MSTRRLQIVNDFRRKLGGRNSESAEFQRETEHTRLTRTADNKSNPVTLLAIESAEELWSKSVGEELGAYTSLGRLLLWQRKVAEAREAIAHALKLADHQFPVLNLPLQLLQARVRAAAALPGVARRNDLTIAARQIRAVIQKSQQLGLYNINCEACLVLGEMELQLNSSSGRAQLISPAAETRSRGLELIARQAEQAITRANVVVAANKPAHEFQR